MDNKGDALAFDTGIKRRGKICHRREPLGFAATPSDVPSHAIPDTASLHDASPIFRRPVINRTSERTRPTTVFDQPAIPSRLSWSPWAFGLVALYFRNLSSHQNFSLQVAGHRAWPAPVTLPGRLAILGTGNRLTRTPKTLRLRFFEGNRGRR